MKTPQRRVLVVVSNPTVSTTLGWPVGFWAAELTHPWLAFREAGYETVIVSPDGGKVELDAMSDPRDESGYSADDIISRGFLETPALQALLDDTPALSEQSVSDFDALYIAGGQAPMFTFRGRADLASAITEFLAAGKPVCAVCHGTAALLDIRKPDGSWLVEGVRMTGFANSEEDYVDRTVGQKVMPFRIEDEARDRGALFVATHPFQPLAVRDGLLITGQQQNSGMEAAGLLIQALGA